MDLCATCQALCPGRAFFWSSQAAPQTRASQRSSKGAHRIGPGLMSLAGNVGLIVALAFIASVSAADGARAVEVTAVANTTGDVSTNLSKFGVLEFGLQPHETFSITSADARVTVRFGNGHADVAPGHWVAFISASGFLTVARNNAGAAATLAVKAGSELTIAKLVSGTFETNVPANTD
jgi:hypothetical protein